MQQQSLKTVEIVGTDMNSIYAVLPRLQDEIQLAKLVIEFIELFDSFEMDHNTVYNKLFVDGEKTPSPSSSSAEDGNWDNSEEIQTVFEALYELCSKYYSDISKKQVFKLLATFNGRHLWWDLSEDTYDAMIECISASPPEGVKRHMVYSDENANYMTMMVNLVPAIDTDKQVIAAEHIYIARAASNIIYNKLKRKDAGSIQDRISYKLHDFALHQFKPQYVFSSPLHSIDAVLNELVKTNTLKLIWKRVPNTETQARTPIVITETVCETPFVIYKVVSQKEGSKKKQTKKRRKPRSHNTRKT